MKVPTTHHEPIKAQPLPPLRARLRKQRRPQPASGGSSLAALANGDDTLSIRRTATPSRRRTRCWPTTLPRKWTPCWRLPHGGSDRTASAQDTQTQAITNALLAYRTGPDQDVFTTNQITSALVAHRSAADQDTATASSIAAALLSY